MPDRLPVPGSVAGSCLQLAGLPACPVRRVFYIFLYSCQRIAPPPALVKILFGSQAQREKQGSILSYVRAPKGLPVFTRDRFRNDAASF